MAARQCARRLHLEVHHPELAATTARTQAAFRIGHRVGEVARRIYGGAAGGAVVEYDEGLEEACRTTAERLRATPAPIFEATFEHAGVFVRVDALLPDQGGWRLVEVKASTGVKEEHAADVAVQAWVLRAAGVTPTRLALAHVDKQFVYAGDGDYRGLLAEKDVTSEAGELIPQVPGWIAAARRAMEAEEPVVAVGAHCFAPWPCPFVARCWPSDTPHPLLDLGGSRERLAALVAEGWRDLRDVPEDRLSDKQRRIQRVTLSGRPELLPEVSRQVAALAFPRYYLDFETIAPAVPIFPGTRPYETVPFQWSCHYEPAPGVLEHADFLDLTGEPPMRRFAESLIRVLGRAGPVLVYTGYERGVIQGLRERYPDLASPLGAIVARLVDLHPLAERGFYHPLMRGSWSLKALLPVVAPDLCYADLPEIQEGTAASEGYLEASDPATTRERKRALERALRAYCRMDTEALVRLARFLAGGPPRP